MTREQSSQHTVQRYTRYLYWNSVAVAVTALLALVAGSHFDNSAFIQFAFILAAIGGAMAIGGWVWEVRHRGV